MATFTSLLGGPVGSWGFGAMSFGKSVWPLLELSSAVAWRRIHSSLLFDGQACCSCHPAGGNHRRAPGLTTLERAERERESERERERERVKPRSKERKKERRKEKNKEFPWLPLGSSARFLVRERRPCPAAALRVPHPPPSAIFCRMIEGHSVQFGVVEVHVSFTCHWPKPLSDQAIM